MINKLNKFIEEDNMNILIKISDDLYEKDTKNYPLFHFHLYYY